MKKGGSFREQEVFMVLMKKIVLYCTCAILLAQSPALAADFRFSPRPNKAALVQWREWSPQTFEEARKQDRLIVLLLSAVWCHWCHVMDETTWSDQGIIDLVNSSFIPLRVDADQRPDIDALYNQGGWPSVAILTPQGDVIDGGNYFSAEELKARLERASSVYKNDKGRITKRSEELRQRAVSQDEQGDRTERVTLDDIAKLLRNGYDEENGGFGRGQKFPNPDALDFLLALHAETRDPALLKMVTGTLDRMAQGGITDRVAGGFFRYATRPDWSEPHYEKMLEVNAGLIRSYANAALALDSERYRRLVRKSVNYVLTTLFDERTGALYGSQDADEEYYLKQHRKGLTPPLVDHTVYADSASLMISALAAASAATGEDRDLQAASRAADLLTNRLYRPEAGIFHVFRNGKALLPGQLADNALFGSALLDLYDATGERRYLDRAGGVAQFLTGRFYDAKVRRFRTSLGSPGVAPAVPGVLFDMNDDLANYRATAFLARFALQSRDRAAQQIVLDALASLAAGARRYPPLAPSYGMALLWEGSGLPEVAVIADGKRARSYLDALNRVYVPAKVVRVLSPVDDREEIRSYGYKARESAYFCAGKRCSRPVRDPRKVGAVLKRFLDDRNEGKPPGGP